MWDKKTKKGSYSQLMNPIRKAMLTKHMFCSGKKAARPGFFKKQSMQGTRRAGQLKLLKPLF
jgi:hypothetical protein